VATLHDIFLWVCGQQHNWVLGGEPLPFCQRCTGLYAGAVLALLVYLGFRPKATNGMLWAHGMFLLLMVPFGYHFVPQTGVLRMLTGQIFAIGLVYYLMLLPGDRWEIWREPSFAGAAAYFTTGGLLLLLSQAAVRWGGLGMNITLSWLGFVGLLVYGTLVLRNLAFLSEFVWRSLRDRVKHAEL